MTLPWIRTGQVTKDLASSTHSTRHKRPCLEYPLDKATKILPRVCPQGSSTINHVPQGRRQSKTEGHA
ncbi:hypothetical protein SLA2020_493940 [Shorea laevis]